MAKEDRLMLSIFTLLLGFLIFMLSIANKTFKFHRLFEAYYVLFLLVGIIIILFGLAMMVNYHFSNRRPFIEKKRHVKKLHFTPYLGIGIFLISIGFTTIYYYQGLSRWLYMISMSISITGILLLIPGLIYYVREMITSKRGS